MAFENNKLTYLPSRGLTSHSTHSRSFRRRIVAAANPTVYAVLSSVCMTAVVNSGVYVYYLKGIVSMF